MPTVPDISSSQSAFDNTKPPTRLAQQSESQSNAATHDPKKLHTSGRPSTTTLPDGTSTITTTPLPGNNGQEATLDGDSSASKAPTGIPTPKTSRTKLNPKQVPSQPLNAQAAVTPKDPTDDAKNPQDQEPRDQERSSTVTSTSNPGYSNPNRVQHSKDQHSKGSTDTSAKGSAAHHAKNLQDSKSRDQEQSSTPPSNLGYSNPDRIQPSKDSQHPKGATDTSAKGRAGHHDETPQDVQVPTGHQGQRDLAENKQPPPQAPGYGLTAAVGNLMSSFIPTAPTPKEKYQQLKEDFYHLQDKFRQSRALNDNYDRELKRRGGELQKASHYINHLQHESQRSKDTINGLTNELNNVHQQLEDARTLSEVRGKELVGSQVFLTKADTLSISEVGDRVNALNEEIFQAAATLGDALIHKRHDLSLKDWEAAAAVSLEVLGKKMTMTLIDQAQKPEPEVNPLLVQVVLQIFMVKFCVSKIQSWYPGDSSFGEFLSAIYSEIRSTENQAVSGRWRALTRSHTRPSAEKWKDELYKFLQSILVTASWAPRSSENEESYGNRLPSIFRATNELRTAMGENFTSADLEIFVYECDEIYDPREMEDAYGDGRHPSGKRAPEPIIGTTGIGLGKIIAEPNAKDAFNIQILTPAKIVLTSTMNEALQPIQSKKIKKKKTVDDGADEIKASKKQVDIKGVANQDSRDSSGASANTGGDIPMVQDG